MAANPSSLKVLVVDDNLGSGEMMCAVLKTLGHRAESAASGEQAIRLAVTHSPDVVLMDIRMPGTDGFEATRRIKTLVPQVVIVAMSGFASPAAIEEAAAAGCDAYLQKPISPERLQTVLNSFCPT
jgi:CheY-like chemotaxis protein